LSKREQVKDIGENRKGERNDNRKRNSFIGSDYVPDNNPESENDEETYVPKNTLHDELKKVLDSQMGDKNTENDEEDSNE